MSRPTKKAIALLRSAFEFTDKNGKHYPVGFSGTDTCEGTLPLWGQLARAGFVEVKSPAPLGHDFSVKLLDAGRAFLEGGSK